MYNKSEQSLQHHGRKTKIGVQANSNNDALDAPLINDYEKTEPTTGKVDKHVKVVAHCVAIVVGCCFGGLNVVTRIGLDGNSCDPLIYGFFRVVGASIILVPIGLYMEGLSLFHYNREDYWLIFLCGFFGISMNIGGFCLGVEWTNADIAALYQPLAAVFAALLATTTGLEQCGTFKAIGISLAVTGVAGATMLGGMSGGGTSILWGNIALLMNTFGSGVYCIAQKPISERYSALKITVAALLSGGVFIGLITLSRYDKYITFDYTGLKPVLAMAYTVLVCSCFCYTAQSWCCKYIDASIPVLYMVLQPLTTGVLAWFILDEELGVYDIIGDMLVCIGLVVCTLGELGYGGKFCEPRERAELKDEIER